MSLGKILTPLLGAALVATVFYSESVTARPSDPNKVTIEYWEKWTQFEYDAMKAVVDDFNASQDRIHVNILSTSNIGQKTMMAVSAGVPPDVAGLFGPDLPQYVDDRAVMSLTEMCQEAGIKAADYIPCYWNICYYQDNVFALPSTPASTALHINRDVLREAGLDPNHYPKTIEELTEMSDKLTTKKNGKIDRMGFHPSEPGWWNWSWGALFGGKVWDGKDQLTMNDEGNVRAMEWVQSFSKKYGVANLASFKQGFGSFSSPQNPFMSNQIAMEMQGVWMHNFIHMFNPKLIWDAVPFPYPQDRPDLANSTLVDLDVLVIPRGAKYPKEAFEFIRFVQTQKEMEKLCLGQRKHSPLAQASAEFWQKHENPKIKLFYDLAFSKNAIPPPQLGIWQELAGEMGVAYDSVALLSKTPKEAMDHAVARMQPRLEQYLSRRQRRKELGL